MHPRLAVAFATSGAPSLMRIIWRVSSTSLSNAAIVVHLRYTGAMKLNIPEELRQAASEAPVEIQDDRTADRFYLLSQPEWERIKRLLQAEDIDPSFYEATEIEVFNANDE